MLSAEDLRGMLGLSCFSRGMLTLFSRYLEKILEVGWSDNIETRDTALSTVKVLWLQEPISYFITDDIMVILVDS